MSEKQKFKPIINLARTPGGLLTYEPFKANSNTYKFIKPGDPIGVEKWTIYEEMKVVAGTGKTFEELATYFKNHKLLLGADKDFAAIRTEAIVETDSMQRSIVDMSKERFNKMFFLCSIFIYRDGADPYAWDFETATAMIADWKEERINELDLFFFASLLIPGYREIFRELREKAEALTEKLSVVSGLQTKGRLRHTANT